jgi:hypothetical protein
MMGMGGMSFNPNCPEGPDWGAHDKTYVGLYLLPVHQAEIITPSDIYSAEYMSEGLLLKPRGVREVIIIDLGYFQKLRASIRGKTVFVDSN